MMKMLQSKAVDVAEGSEPEPEVNNKPEPKPEVVPELVSLQEKISSQSTEIVKLPLTPL